MISFSKELEGVSLLFDLDGTLLETSPTFLRIINQLLQQKNFPPISLNQLQNSISYGVKAMLQTSFGHYGHVFCDKSLQEHSDIFLSLYRQDMTTGTIPYDGLEPLLEKLHQTPVRMAIATNKTEEYAHTLVRFFAWEKYFPVIFGPQSVTEKKPAPHHLYETVSALGGSLEKAIMIGDSPVDQEAAHRANMPFMLHENGYSGGKSMPAEARFKSYHDFEKKLFCILNSHILNKKMPSVY
jgi:phosphoglycolate phosphatase